MSIPDRIASLERKHEELEHRLHEETGRPLPNEKVLHSIKREKLAIKDEIERMRHHA